MSPRASKLPDVPERQGEFHRILPLMGHALSVAVTLLVAAGCSKAHPPRTRTPPPRPLPLGDPLPLKITLSALPGNPIPLANLGKFQLGFVVENVGTTSVDPQLERSSVLLVNGKPAKDWDITIGNGPRDARWTALPPHDRLQFGYAFGNSLFDKVGDYTFIFSVGSVSSPPFTLHVVAH